LVVEIMLRTFIAALVIMLAGVSCRNNTIVENKSEDALDSIDRLKATLHAAKPPITYPDTVDISSVDILNSERFVDQNSPDFIADSAKYNGWKLTERQLLKIIMTSRFVEGDKYKGYADLQPCYYQGEVKLNDSLVFRFDVNSSSYITLYNKQASYNLRCYGMDDLFLQPTHREYIAPGDLNVSGIPLGVSPESLVSSLGKPDSILRTVNEFTGDSVYNYHYKESIFKVTDNKLDGFTIKNSDFAFGEKRIRVGDRATVIESVFPASYKKQFPGDNYNIILVPIGESDEYLQFILFANNIVEFGIWVDW